MNITYQPTAPFEIKPGKQAQVKPGEAYLTLVGGAYYLHGYIHSTSNARQMRETLTKIEQEAQQRRARARALRGAKKHPQQADALVDGQVERVTVRGVDKRSGDALITRAGEHQTRISTKYLLRVLTDEEHGCLTAADAERAAAQRLLTQAAERLTRTYDADHMIDVQVDVSYRPEHDDWQAATKYRGADITTTAASASDAVSDLTCHLIALTWTYGVTYDDKIRLVNGAEDVTGVEYLAMTEQDAQAYLHAKASARAATVHWFRLLEPLRFDLSPFQDED